MGKRRFVVSFWNHREVTESRVRRSLTDYMISENERILNKVS
jgi:hypothetical protein